MATAQELSAISPTAFYPLASFEKISGISATRRRAAKKRGVELATVNAGRRKFVKGSDGILYIEQLAILTAQEQEAKR